jgi:hypothetical protein
MTIGDDRTTELLRLAHEITDLEGRLADCVAQLVDLDIDEGGSPPPRPSSWFDRRTSGPSPLAPPEGPASSWTWAPAGGSTFRKVDAGSNVFH